MLNALLLLIVGGALLVGGAEVLVRYASRLATSFGVSSLIVGLTVVAFGTSAPELAVSASASLAGNTDIALGNVVGSNIFNVFFILGVSALVAPLSVSVQLIRWDVPIMIGVSIIVFLMSLNGTISLLEAAILVALLVAFNVFVIRRARGESLEHAESILGDEDKPIPTSLKDRALMIVFIVIGLAVLVFGSNLFIDGAVTIARSLGVSDLVVGLTIVAGGTSLPEVATSVIATIKGERDIAVGNVVGSNIFNLLAVLGVSGLLTTEGLTVLPASLAFDMPVMLAAAVACLPIFFTGNRINRWEGALFVALYVVFVVYLVLDATQSAHLGTLREAMLFFGIPVIVATLGVFVVREIRLRRIGGADQVSA